MIRSNDLKFGFFQRLDKRVDSDYHRPPKTQQIEPTLSPCAMICSFDLIAGDSMLSGL
jgi:hypothetical protein